MYGKSVLFTLVFLFLSACGGGGSGGASSGACGPLTKVLNGQSCGEVRSVVRLEIQKDDDTIASCTGTFISQTSILTAAHCLVGGFDQPFRRPIGVTVVFNGTATAATGYVVPQNYIDSKQFGLIGAFDIGIVKIDENFMLAVGAIPQPLLTSRIPIAGEKVIINGYGITETGDSSYEVLKASEVTYTGLDQYNRIVLVPEDDNSGVCSGDSGSALLARNADGEYGIIGVTSYGESVTAGNLCGFGSLNVFAPIFNRGNAEFLLIYAPDAPLI